MQGFCDASCGRCTPAAAAPAGAPATPTAATPTAISVAAPVTTAPPAEPGPFAVGPAPAPESFELNRAIQGALPSQAAPLPPASEVPAAALPFAPAAEPAAEPAAPAGLAAPPGIGGATPFVPAAPVAAPLPAAPAGPAAAPAPPAPAQRRFEPLLVQGAPTSAGELWEHDPCGMAMWLAGGMCWPALTHNIATSLQPIPSVPTPLPISDSVQPSLAPPRPRRGHRRPGSPCPGSRGRAALPSCCRGPWHPSCA